MPSSVFNTRLALALYAAALTLVSPAHARAQSGGEVLSNSAVVNMITAKVSKDLILTKIRTTKTSFDVTAGGMVRLHQAKVPQDIMLAMMTAAADPKMATPAAGAAEVLTNNEVVQMVQGQLPRPIIIEKIRSSKSRFDTTSDGLVSLQSNKVPDEVVKAMMAAPVAPSK